MPLFLISILKTIIQSKITYYILACICIFLMGMKYQALRVERASLKEVIKVTTTYSNETQRIRDRYKGVYPNKEKALSGQVSEHFKGRVLK